MGHVKVWHKLALMVVFVLLPAAFLGYRVLRTDYRAMRAEQQRLVGLQHLQALRHLTEQLQQHRAVSVALAAGDASFQPLLPVIQDRIEDELENIDQLEMRQGAALGTIAQWHEVQNRWEDLRAVHMFRKPEESNDLHARLQAEVSALATLTADRSRLSSATETERRALATALAATLPAQIDVLGQTQALATAAAQRRTVTPAERAQLHALRGQLRLLGDETRTNADAAFAESDALREDYETLVIQDAIARETLGDFIEGTLLRPEKIDLAPFVVFETAQKPMSAALTLFDAESTAARRLTETRLQLARQNLNAHSGILLGALLLSLLLAFVISRNLTRRVAVLGTTLGEVEQGNYQARAAVRGHDELARMAASLNQVLENTQALLESRSERDHLEAAVARLLVEVHGAAEGDLTREAEVTTEVTGPIADSFNHMVRQLRQVIRRVQRAAGQVGTSAGHLQTMTDYLSQGSEAQAEQVRETTLAIQAMAISIQRVSENAAASATVGQQALTNARKGNKAVQNTMQMMNHVRDEVRVTARHIRQVAACCQDIAPVGRVIDDIAEWTSILAFNAALQAGAAGAEGHPYAILGETAERLASRAAEAARQIARMTGLHEDTTGALAALEEASRQVVDSSLVAGQAGQALAEIEAVARRLTDLIHEIAGAAELQARGAAAVSQSMQGISEVTQRTAQGARQAALSVNQIGRLADELRGAVSAFQLPADLNGEATVPHLDGVDVDATSLSMIHAAPAAAS